MTKTVVSEKSLETQSFLNIWLTWILRKSVRDDQATGPTSHNYEIITRQESFLSMEDSCSEFGTSTQG